MEWYEYGVKKNLATNENIFQMWSNIEISGSSKTKHIHQAAYMKGNAKSSSSGRRKIIPKGNTAMQEKIMYAKFGANLKGYWLYKITIVF